jgi:hypothetical protein
VVRGGRDRGLALLREGLLLVLYIAAHGVVEPLLLIFNLFIAGFKQAGWIVVEI